MNPLIESLSHWGSRATDFAWPLLWQSSLLIGALLLLDLLLRRRTRAVLRYALWLLVLLKLLLPPSLALPSGLGYWLGASHPPPPPPPPPRAVSVITVSGTLPVVPASSWVAPTRPELSRQGELLLIWLAGSAILLGFLVRRSWQAARLLRQAHLANEDLQSLLDGCRRQLQLRHPVRLKLSTSAVSPAICGLWRPAVLLPRELVRRLTPEQLRAVLFHELVHLRRYDVWVNCLQALLQIAYWWHPLVWLANARIRRVREEAVDEAVMVALGSLAETYPATLLEVAKLAFARPLTVLGLVGIFESKGALEQRIRRLLDRPVPRRAKLNVTGILAVATCGALLLPMARGHRAETPPPASPPTSAPTPGPSVMLNCGILEVTDDAWRVLQLGPASSVGTNGHQVWVGSQERFANLSAALSNQPGIFVLARPRLITVSGVTGTISVTRDTNFNGQTVQLGPVCELTAQINGSDIDLTVKASVTELTKVDGDGQKVFAVNAVGYMSREAANVRVTVPDNGGVLVHNPGVSTSEGQHLLLVVRPAILREDGEASPADSRPSPAADVNKARVEPPRAVEVGQDDSKALGFDWFLGNTLIMGDGRIGIQGGTAPSFAGVRRVSRQGTRDDERSISPTTGTPPPPGFEHRVFKVNPNIFASALTNSPSLAGQSFAEALRGFLEAAGVNVSPPNQIFYSERTGQLMLKASPSDMDRVANALEILLPRPPPQMTVETKFIEAPEEFVKGISMGTVVSPPDATNQMRILSDSQVRAFLQELERTPDVDILCAPKVTTLSGRQTQIQVVEIRSILTGIDPEAVAEPARTASDVTNTSPFVSQPVPLGPTLDVIPSVAEDGTVELTAIANVTNTSPFVSQPVPLGPTLDLIPSVAEDGYTLELTAIASLTEFLGYDKPTNTVSVYVDGEKQEVQPPLPRIRTRPMMGKARLYDGQSLLLIGSAASITNRFVDKVPLLGDLPLVGRLFRSSGVSRIDRCSVILITPTLIDPAGNPIHVPEALPFDPNSIPPQPK